MWATFLSGWIKPKPTPSPSAPFTTYKIHPPLAPPRRPLQLVAILHREFKSPGSLHRTLQISSVHTFEKILLHELLTETPGNFMDAQNLKPLWLWWLKPGSRERFYFFGLKTMRLKNLLIK